MIGCLNNGNKTIDMRRKKIGGNFVTGRLADYVAIADISPGLMMGEDGVHGCWILMMREDGGAWVLDKGEPSPVSRSNRSYHHRANRLVYS